MGRQISIKNIQRFIEDTIGERQQVSIEDIHGTFPKRKAIFFHDMYTPHSFIATTADGDYTYYQPRGDKDGTRCILLDTEVCGGDISNDNLYNLYLPIEQIENDESFRKALFSVNGNLVFEDTIEKYITVTKVQS